MSNHFFPVFVLVLVKTLGYHLFALLCESHDFLTNRAGSARLQLMDEVHDPHTCTTITVIGYPLCQD
jgi:hypothetical protein